MKDIAMMEMCKTILMLLYSVNIWILIEILCFPERVPQCFFNFKLLYPSAYLKPGAYLIHETSTCKLFLLWFVRALFNTL